MATWKFDSSLADQLLVAKRELGFVLDENQSICLSAGLIELFICGFFVKTVSNIFPDGAWEEHGFLLDDGHVFLKVLRIETFDVLFAKTDGALIRIIETLQQLNNGWFATTAGSNEGNCLVLGNLNLGFLDDLNILLGGVSELDVT